MKIKGLESLNYKIPVVLKAGEKATTAYLDPLPYDFYSQLLADVPEPELEISGFAKKNGHIVKDENNEAIPIREKTQKYIAEQNRVQNLHNVATVYEATKNCFEYTTLDTGKTRREFLEEVAEELRESGFTVQQMMCVIHAVQKDSGIASITEEKKTS